MRLDIFRRPETDGNFSYLAVPESRVIPEEATNTDWEIEMKSLETGFDEDKLPSYSIYHLAEQLREKGYAVTAYVSISDRARMTAAQGADHERTVH
jgi:purine nucleoside permease